MSDSFSKRHGFHQVHEVPILVRTDAPGDLRAELLLLAYDSGFSPKSLRPVVCRALKKRPDPNNWSEDPNIRGEVRSLIDDCEWYRIYDIAEAIDSAMQKDPSSFKHEKFETELNEYFVENGIGWRLAEGRIEVRGAEVSEQSFQQAVSVLTDLGLTTAGKELHEAKNDLSRRPLPDITGAIQHSMAALECVARVACGDGKATLGDIIKRHSDLIPKPLDEAVTKVWGFASENARHINEGREPSFEEAELVVSMVAGVCTYLAKKNGA